MSGFKVKYHTGKNWDQLLTALKKGQLDMLPALYINEDRKKFISFTSSYLASTEYFFTKSDYPIIKDIKELEGKTISLVKGYSIIKWVKSNYPKINVIEKPNILGCLKSVKSGESVAFIGDNASTTYNIEKNFQTNLKINNVVEQRKPIKIYMGVKKEYSVLAQIINKAIQQITKEQKRKIIANWMSLIDRSELNLTASEKEWLDKEEFIRYVFDPDWKPLEWSNNLGEHKGIISDLIKLLQHKSGIKLKPVLSKTWKEAVTKVKAKQADMFSGIGETNVRKKYLKFSEKPLFNTPYVFVSKHGTDYLDGFSDARGKKIAVTLDYTIDQILTYKKPGQKLIKVKSIQEGFDKLNKGEIDIFITNAVTAKYYINVLAYKELKIAYKTKYNLRLKIALKKGLPKEALEIINKSIDLISEKEISDIVHKWTEVKIHKQTNWLLITQFAGISFLIIVFILWNNKKLKSMVNIKTLELRLLLKSFDKNVIASKTDTKGFITYVSEAFCNISAYTAEELIGKPHNIVRHPDMPKDIFVDLWQTIKSGKVWKGEIKNRKKTGDYYWVDIVITPIFNSKGNISGYSAIRHDITAQKAVESLSKNLELKVEERTKDLNKLLVEVEQTNKKIEAMHKLTKDSINYAALIQGALIPDNREFKHYFQDYFVFWHPKDIVGGDIYLFEALGDGCLIMAIDCTGHGVPGAFVTMLVKAIERQLLAEITNKPKMTISPAWVLSYFNQHIKKLLKQESADSISNAGFDGGIIYYNKRDKILKFSGAETPLFYTQDGEIKTIKGSRYSVGYKKCDMDYDYKEYIIEVKEGMQFYLTTDGYLDQNGGNKGFPFGKKRFKNIIQEYHGESMADQQEMFLYLMSQYEAEFKHECGEHIERNDDMTVIGLTI